MEQIRTSTDRIFDQYTTDNTMFESDSNTSILGYASRAKKRKVSLENVSRNEESTLKDDSFCSLNGSQYVPPSPWEIRRIKADLVDTNTTVTILKKELESRSINYSHMESMYKTKVTDLEKELEKSTTKVIDLDKHLKFIRKREAAQNNELIKLRNKCATDKQTYDETVSDLQKSNKFLEGKCRQIQHEMGSALANIQQKYNDLEKDHSSTSEKCNKLQEENTAMQVKIQKNADINKEFVNQQRELEKAQRELKTLEDEILSLSEWKAMHKTFESNMCKLQDLERKNQRLQNENKELHKCIGDKLLLEEEVENLKIRVVKNEKISEEVISLNTKIPYIEKDLAAFKQIAIDYCSPNSPTASNLRSLIDEILQKDLTLVNENGSIKAEKNAIAVQIDELKKQVATLTKANNDLQNNLKDHKASFYRVQKKLRLVVTERDCYKQLIENYEKNVTISIPSGTETGTDAQMRLRLEMLEKTVAGYKEMCSSLEKELQSVKSSPDHVEPSSNEQYKQIRKELDSLREDNERLRRRKGELELLFEHSNMKDAYNIQKYKVMHMAMNPADQTYENHKNEIEKLQAEIERLKRKNRKLEADNEEITAANLTFDIKEMNNLRAQIKSLESQKQHITDSYRTNINEFRDACYLLFGFKVDTQHGNNIYRISSMYAESPDEYLTFKISEDSDISLMESVYSNSINDFIEKTLLGPNSIPVFLSSLTIDLFNRTTMV